MQPPDFAKAIAQYEILQWCFGLGAVAFLTFQMIRTWRRDLRADERREDDAASNALANMPKYYMEGPIIKAFGMLDDIIKSIKDLRDDVARIERKIDDWTEPEEDRRRRR